MQRDPVGDVARMHYHAGAILDELCHVIRIHLDLAVLRVLLRRGERQRVY